MMLLRLENLSLVELAQHYIEIFVPVEEEEEIWEEYLEELAKRDRLSKMTCDERLGLRFEEPDNQLAFDFHKDLVSEPEATNNTSVKDDPWKEAYEAGFRAGGKHGFKIAETIKECHGVNEEENEKS